MMNKLHKIIIVSLSLLTLGSIASAMVIDSPQVRNRLNVFGVGNFGKTSTTTISGDGGSSVFSGNIKTDSIYALDSSGLVLSNSTGNNYAFAGGTVTGGQYNLSMGALTYTAASGSNTKNICLGYGCMQASVTAERNFVAGFEAFKNGGGMGNIIIGDSSGTMAVNPANATNYNTVLGVNSMQSLSITDSTGANTIVGSGTGNALTTGKQNTFIGANLNPGDVSGYVAISDGAGTVRFQVTDGAVYSFPGLTTDGFLKTAGGAGVVSIDTTTYLSSVGLSSSGSLTIGSSPLTANGTITADINLANANAWSGLQTFTNVGTSTFTGNIEANNILARNALIAEISLSDLGNANVGGTMTASNFVATSTTATNAFSGNLTVTGTTGLTGRLTAVYASTTMLTTSQGATFATVSGNVGIGTTSPASKLSVQGGAIVSGNLVVAGITATSTLDFTTATTKLQGQDKSMILASSTLSYIGSYGATGSTTIQAWNPSRPIILTGVYCKSDIGNNILVVGNGTASSTSILFCNKVGQGLTAESITVALQANIYFQLGTASSTVPNTTTVTLTFKNND